MLSIYSKERMSIVQMAMRFSLQFILILFWRFGCAKEGAVAIKTKTDAATGTPPSSSVSVTSVQVANDRFVIRGTNLKAVKSAKITWPNGTNKIFIIESQTSDQLAALSAIFLARRHCRVNLSTAD